jgi:predicted SprT family Zn-dependent metalloprotease
MLFNKHARVATEKNHNNKGGKEMLSRDCDGCSQRKPCSKRFDIAEKGEKVYCPDGTAHLVDASKSTI